MKKETKKLDNFKKMKLEDLTSVKGGKSQLYYDFEGGTCYCEGGGCSVRIENGQSMPIGDNWWADF